MSSDDPGLTQVLNQVVDLAVQQLFVALPGTVTSYDASSQQADVQLEMLDAYVDRAGDRVTRPYPTLLGVPVVQLYTALGGLSVPLASGDSVVCIFARHSLSRWQESGGQVDPGDLRIEGPTGAIAIPGLHPRSKVNANVDPDKVVLFGETVAIGSATANVAMVNTDRLIQWLQTHTHPTGVGPSGPPAQGATLNNIKSSKNFMDD